MSEQREQFQRRVEELVAQFEREVDRREWVTGRYPKKLRDEARQVYEVPALRLQKGPINLLLDPIGYDVPGAEGAADLYLMPGYDPTASIYFEDGQWVIHYAFPPDPFETHSVIETQILPLSAETINQVLNSIVEHAVPSVETGTQLVIDSSCVPVSTPKNIVVFIDGTWQNSASSVAQPTNVHGLFLSVSRSNQIKIYYPGVGSDTGWLGRMLRGMAGKGIFQTARLAWAHIAANHEQGDKIFIFGFSRGAHAARHLAGMIVRHGLRGWRGNIEEEFRDWLVSVRSPCTLVRERVHFLGLFDCVPGNQLYLLRDRSSHLNTDTLEDGIEHFRHAVSIHERRWSFRPLVFRPGKQQSFAQHWFPGYHSDVGGGHGVAEGLAAFSQWWMLREAYGLGLDFDNIKCPLHRAGHALGVLRTADPEDRPVSSDYWTTCLGLTWDRQKRPMSVNPDPTPNLHDLDECPRCQHPMFDYFLTDVGKRWLKSKGLVK